MTSMLMAWGLRKVARLWVKSARRLAKQFSARHPGSRRLLPGSGQRYVLPGLQVKYGVGIFDSIANSRYVIA